MRGISEDAATHDDRPRRRRRRAVTVLAWLLVLPFLAWAVVRTFDLVDTGRVAYFLLSLTPWVAAAAILVTLLVAALRRWIALLVAVVATGALVVAVAGRALPDGDAVPASADRLTVMSLNMDDGRADPAAVARLVRRERVDVLLVLEAGPRAIAAVEAAGVEDRLPRLVTRRSRGGGSALFADRRLRELPRPRLGRAVAAPSVRLRVGPRAVDVTAIHPPHPSSDVWEAEWKRTFATLPDVREATARQVVLGDFNATLDQPPLRALLARGYRDAAAATGAGLRMTWPVGEPFPFVAIDHVLAGAGVRVERFETARVPRTDHRAVIATLAFAS